MVAKASPTATFRYDPTRTTLLRRRFTVYLTKRIRAFWKKVFDLIVVEDAFGLKRKPSPLDQVAVLSVANTRFAFQSSPQQVASFEAWLANELPMGASTIEEFIEAGYARGAGRAFTDVSKLSPEGLAFSTQTRGELLASAFNQPVSRERLELLVSRTLTDLQGVDAVMAQQMKAVLAEGLVTGSSPRSIASAMNRVVNTGLARARTIARTEIIRAHAEGQLLGMASMGVKKVTAMAEWRTVGDDRVCQLCQPMEAVTLTLKEAQGMIPRHPNCRCMWVPANVGEKTKGQVRSPSAIRERIRTSIARERKSGGSVDATPWQGADKTIAKKRPKNTRKVLALDKRQRKRK